MKYKLVVAGTRIFNEAHYQSKMKPALNKVLYKMRSRGVDLVIISGKAPGADTYGEVFAKENRLEVEEFPANWNKYGKAAGPIRNEEMARSANAVLVFWDGKSRGSKNMISMAEKYNKPLKVIRI